METDLYKIRSISSCISAAYTLFGANLKRFFRRTWLPLLIYAIVASANIMLYLPDKDINDLGLEHPIPALIIMYVIKVLLVLAGIWAFACIVNLFNNRGYKRNLVGTLIMAIFFVLLNVILYYAGFVYGYGLGSVAGVQNIGWAFIVSVWGAFFILIAIGVPLCFSITKYFIDDNSSLKDVFIRDFVFGFRHWGFVFVVMLITLIIFLIVAAICGIPLIVIVLAQTINQLGMLMGDPSGVPGYFVFLIYFITTLIIFIVMFMSIWVFCVAYYAYGSVETNELEHKNERI